MYLLDTDHITILQWRSQPAFDNLGRRMRRHPNRAFYLSIVSFHEQSIGANAYITRARKATAVVRAYAMLEIIRTHFSAPAQVLAFDQPAAALFDSLRTRKVRIGTMDLRIAAIALSRNLTVVTRNLRDFAQVPGLKVEDWTT